MANIINKYPYTDFHELNLDYILSQINANNDKVESLASDLDTVANTYVKKVEIVNGSVLKVYKGNGSVNTYALPSGNNFVFDVYNKEDSTSLFELEVDETSYYDTNGDMTVFSDVLYSGIPFVMRYIPGGPDSVITCILPVSVVGGPQIVVYDDTDSGHEQWKVFTPSWGLHEGVQTFGLTRTY